MTAATVQHDPQRKPVPVPTCPVCAATGHRCSTPDGRWHLTRDRLLADTCRCATCRGWLLQHPEATQPSFDQLVAYDGDLLNH